MNCSNLKEVKLLNGLKTIEGHAFALTWIEEIVIPKTVDEIAYGAFADCTRLRKASLSLSIKKLGDNIFIGTSVPWYIKLFSNSKAYITYAHDAIIRIKEIYKNANIDYDEFIKRKAVKHKFFERVLFVRNQMICDIKEAFRLM
jgi:hypothetical protein